MVLLVPVCPRRAGAQTHRGMVFVGKCSEKLGSRLAVLSRFHYSYDNEQDSTMVPISSFVP